MTDDRYPPPSGSYPAQEPPRTADPLPGAPRRSNGVAIAALVCGIVALLLSWLPGINLLAMLLGLIALICGFVGLGKAKDPTVVGGRGMAIAGIVTGLLALVVSVLVYVGLARLFNDPGIQQQLRDAATEMQQQLDEAGEGGG